MKNLLRKFIPLRNRYLMAVDFLGVMAMPSVALLLRTESIEMYLAYLVPTAVLSLVMAAMKLGVYYRMGMYAQYWPYAGTSEVITMVRATALAALLEMVIFVAVFTRTGVMPLGFPRSVTFLDALFSMMFVIGLRVSISLLFTLNSNPGTPTNQKTVLIVGAGDAGLMIGRELQRNPHLGLNPIGYVDDDQQKIGKRINGIKVIGSLPNLQAILEKLSVMEVIIAIPTASGKLMREVVEACKARSVPSRTVPGLLDILRGTARVEQIRNVQLEDLLRRGPVRTNSEQVREILNCSRVLVTGAGGSIGAEICRQVMDSNPHELVLLGHGETSIYNISTELRDLRNKKTKVVPVIGDIRDRSRMQQIFERCRPDIVFHAAAHKHLPLMEDNIEEAVTNNILGTKILVELAATFETDRFVMISTDKAVNPVSILGVTKRIAELIVRDAGRQSRKRFVTVRFGNVLGSRGSVVPLFQRQIRLGGPITVADPEVKRFFMTIPEAVQLVLQSASMGRGGEVFVLDMGEQIRILDIARDLLRLNRLEEGKDIEIVFSGLKPGEKICEELFFAKEKVERTEHEKILVCRNGLSQHDSGENSRALVPDSVLEALALAARQADIEAIYSILKRVVPEYQTPMVLGDGLAGVGSRKERIPEQSEDLAER
jgi:FlaA1/EpsC-like NDP-sugar epimerase